ncbi:MAG: FAD-binding oxidoreductase [Rhodospirillales bacterium]|nr:FAD-binding oxidoreductase [Rhodospirillales bacterium]
MKNSPSGSADGHVTVVGAGIVGTCSALYLQRQGFYVTQVDRDGPGEGASSGNAGSLGVASIPPGSMPGLIWKLPGMMTDPLTPLAVDRLYMLRSMPWFMRFMWNSRRAKVERIADARNALLSRIFEGYQPLIDDAGAEDLIAHQGKLHVYERADGLARSAYALEMRRRRGVEVREMNGDEAREMEPALSPIIKGAAFFPGVHTVLNPLRLVQDFAKHFVRRGGTLLREAVRGFEIGADGPSRMITDAGGHDVDKVVIAAGAWSKTLAKQMGSNPPLEAERGYHNMITDPGIKIGTSITSNERYVVLTQMEHGLRVSGIAQFSGLHSEPDYALADRVLENARVVVPSLEGKVDSKWSGPRPSLPDSLPIIGPSPRYPKVYFAFGHDHVGLAAGGITGKLIGELVAGRPTSVDLTPYRADRF